MKSEWARRGIARRDFRSGGVDPEDFEEVRYKKNKQTDWRRRRRICKKSKDGEPCKFTVTKVIGTYKRYSFLDDAYYNAERTVLTCERCGRYSWSSYSYN